MVAVMAMLLALVSPPVVAGADVGRADDRAALVALAAQDARVAAIGDRLAVGNRALCRTLEPRPGFAVHHLAQYVPAYRAAARSSFGLDERIAVVAVVPGGAAQTAGLRARDRIVAINGVAEPAAALPRGAADAPAQAARDRLARAFAAGPVTLTVERGGKQRSVTIAAPSGCASNFQVQPAADYQARADGRTVEVTTAIVDYAADDTELAAVLAHELAHNILGHRARLEAAGVPGGIGRQFGRNAGAVRKTEEEADRLSLYLLANAGYDARLAPLFWRRFGKDHGFGIFADPTHPSFKARVAEMEAELATIARAGPERPLIPRDMISAP